ncbi:hypothetical protein FB45DRAFT_1066873 [Roridomyces roridus]|uniref:Uncharacterized protein n=1 Tax=Roridomyces roridus TaxID=1738132 RepID=A0AAD7B3B0_9AGAR|nr:hypothetical protein FB45DRAFT_1066873 [Roridomyces roridus]
MPKATLATIPQELRSTILSALTSFSDLHSAILSTRHLHAAFKAHRRKVLSSVGRNLLGSLFTEALLLARCQEKRDGSEALKVKGLSSSTVRLLLKNAEMVCELQRVMFGLLQEGGGGFDVYNKASLTKFARAPPEISPSNSESLRFKSAAYRFTVFCLLSTVDARIAFLARFPKLQVLELSHFVSGLWTLVSVIRGHALETNADWYTASHILSTGPSDILGLWSLKTTRDTRFKAALKAASTSSTGGDDDDDDDDDDFMGEWCALMDRQGFPRECSESEFHSASATAYGSSSRPVGKAAILDGVNERVGVLLKREEVLGLGGVELKAGVGNGKEKEKETGGNSKAKKRKARVPVLDDPFG